MGASIPTRAELGEAAPRRPPRTPWMRNRLRTGPNYLDLKGLVRGLELHTVCEEASCPNVYECWEAREATFLILGRLCTRRCGFCDIATGKPGPLDPEEHVRVAEAVERMGLHFAVVTGVERDDAPPQVATVMDAEPDVYAHNLETSRRMHRTIRPGFRYERSLDVLRQAKELKPRIPTKSNVIVGMGETFEEVVETLGDLRAAGVDLMTIGQYLSPSADHHVPVHRWVHPDEFAEYRRIGEELGFAWVESGPLVRSSYHAGKQYRAAAARLGAP